MSDEDRSLGDRELDVMGVVWELGSATVGEVREKLRDELAYTTVLTILRNLEEKGFLTHEAEGRAHRYFPRIAQGAARRSALARVIDKLFQGSTEELVAHLVEDQALTTEELQRLRQRLADPARNPNTRRKR
jgi:BlaI family transcriptional regulator, penicillinase repressor